MYFKLYCITGCVSNFAFALLLFGTPIGNPSSAVGLKIFSIAATIKKYESKSKNKKL